MGTAYDRLLGPTPILRHVSSPRPPSRRLRHPSRNGITLLRVICTDLQASHRRAYNRFFRVWHNTHRRASGWIGAVPCLQGDARADNQEDGAAVCEIRSFLLWQGGAEISVATTQTTYKSRNLDIQHSVTSRTNRLKNQISRFYATMLARHEPPGRRIQYFNFPHQRRGLAPEIENESI